ncbi:ATP-dependent DNA ligase [Candidatus Woesebacteria bacterium]|nr:ATP-dependent DNA ligase [Candidatus Woesebacteria bacterium]
MTFLKFSQTLQELESISSRLRITEVLAQLYRSLDEAEQKPACYLLQGSLVPAYLSLEFQLSVKMVQRVLAQLVSDSGASGEETGQHSFFESNDSSAQLSKIEQLYKSEGDLGKVAEMVVSQLANDTQKDGQLQIIQVHEALRQIALESGSGSQERKVQKLVELLAQLEPVGAKFVVRIVLGRLRLGFSVMTLLDALSWVVGGNKLYREQLELAYQKKADIGELAAGFLRRALSEEVDKNSFEEFFQSYSAQVGIPIVPALCQRLNTAAQIVEKMGQVLVEPKYDGLRVQIHCGVIDESGRKTVRVFTRNLDDATHMFPEASVLLEQVKEACVLDGEVIGYDPETGRLKAFQETITRKRKHDVQSISESVPVRFYLFDLLVKGDESLLDRSLRERKDLLNKLLQPNEQFVIAPTVETNDAQEVRRLHEQFLHDGLEGAVIKKVDAPYQSGRKGWSWVKIKEEEGSRGKLADTLDVVVIGYYRGRGKRAQFGIGAFLVGVFDSESQQIKTIAKIGTGITEEALGELKQLFDSFVAPQAPHIYTVDKGLEPDVWIQPEVVVEVAADEITRSPVHSAGLALRFPRFLRVRTDKSWDQATTTLELTQMQPS